MSIIEGAWLIVGIILGGSYGVALAVRIAVQSKGVLAESKAVGAEARQARIEAGAHKARGDMWKRRAAEMGFIATVDSVDIDEDGSSVRIEGTAFPFERSTKKRIAKA